MTRIEHVCFFFHHFIILEHLYLKQEEIGEEEGPLGGFLCVCLLFVSCVILAFANNNIASEKGDKMVQQIFTLNSFAWCYIHSLSALLPFNSFIKSYVLTLVMILI